MLTRKYENVNHNQVQNAPLAKEEQPYGHLLNFSNLCRIKNTFQLPSEVPYENTIKLKQHPISRNPLSNIQYQEGKRAPGCNYNT